MLSIKDIPNNYQKENKESGTLIFQITTKQDKKISIHNANTLKKITKILKNQIR